MPEISIWRTTIAPGDLTYIWARAGHLPNRKAGAPGAANDYTLDDSIQLTQFNWGRTFFADDPTFATGLNVPAKTPLGVYHLHIQGQETGTLVTIDAPPEPRPIVNVPPAGAGDSAAINVALSAGKSVQLSAGVYTIDSTINLPAGAYVRGAHRDATFLKRLPHQGEYANRFFTGEGDYFSLSDFTAEGIGADIPFLFHSNSTHKNVAIQRLRLRNMGSIMAEMPGAFVQDMEYVNSGGPTGGNHQMWKDIFFTGIGPFGSESGGQGDQYALINATWRDTGRGLILRTGPTNSYFNSLSFSGIDMIHNGNEVILAEDIGGIGLQNCIFTHVSIRNCMGSILFFGTPAVNNIFRFIRMEGGGGIAFVPDKTKQTDNLFDSVELRGCVGIHLGGATGNTFKGLAIISPRPSWTNQGGYVPAFYARSSAITGSAGNAFNPVTIMDLPEGWKEMD